MIYARDLAAISTDSKERFAQNLFDLVVVEQQLRHAAGDGLACLRLRQTVPIDLSDTQAAKRLVTTLSQYCYDTAWVRAVRPGDVMRGITQVEYVELEVGWKDS